MTFADRVKEALAPITLGSADLGTYIGALSDPTFQEVEDYASDGPLDQPGWSILLDLNRIPDKGLDWIAQFVGVQLDAGITAAQKRQQIQQVSGWQRGTAAAIAAAPVPYLTGTKTVILRERDPAASPSQPAYGLTVVTRSSETPPEDFAATNLIANGGFESNVTGWNLSLCTMAVSSAQQKYGAQSALVTATGVSPLPYYDVAVSGATGGKTYTASAWVYCDASSVGKNFVIQLWELGGASGADGSGTSFVGALGWQRVSVTRTIAQNDRTLIRLQVGMNASATVGNTFYLDGAQMEQNPIATPYIETNGASASRPIGQGPVGAALLRQKPAGIILNYVILAGQDYSQVYNGGATTYATIFSTYTTYQGLLNGVPGT